MVTSVTSCLRYLRPPGVFTVILAQVFAVVLQGGVCTNVDVCTEAVRYTHIVPVQVLLMSLLVYKQKTRISDVLKCWGACCFLASAESLLRFLHPLVGLPLLWVVVYAQVSISLYMYHRFIFHAHWSARTQGFERWLWDMVRANYTMHYFEHHQISHTKEDAQKLAKLERVSLTPEQIEHKYNGDWLLQNFVHYTNRGITIEGPVGLLGAFMFFSILPTGTLCVLSYARGDVLSCALHLAGSALGMYQTMVQHDKYHADAETLEEFASKSWCGWLWKSAEMTRIIHEHKLHHDGKNHDRYFSMLPFDCFFIYLLWPEEHMRPTMVAIAQAIVNWIRIQAVSAYQSCWEACEQHRCMLNLAALAGVHAWVASISWTLFVADIVLHLLFVAFVYWTWVSSMGPCNLKFPRFDPRCFSFRARPGTWKAKIGDAHALDMSHIDVPFLPFLCAHYLIVPNATFLWVSESVKLVVRDHLQRAGLLTVAPCDYPHVVANLCLEGMQAINFKRMSRDDCGHLIAEFSWTNIAFIQMDTTVGKVKAFRVLVDVESRVMVSASIDGQPVSAKKAMILLWFDTVFGTHVKIHAMANWGIARHVEGLQLWWMQACSVMYNYFGFIVFSRFITEFWFKMGLTLRCYTSVKQASSHSASTGVPFHGNVHQLAKHSVLVRFMLKVRKFFLAEFERHKSDFEGADAEAMFVGTICHSLDHSMMDENLKDPLWLDVEDPEFGAMAELMRHVRVGFVPDLPGLVFNRRYKHMRHPFYQTVYKYARSIDSRLADCMDAGIVK